MRKIKNLTGFRNGKLIVVKFSHSSGGAYWICKCDCGNKIVVRRDHIYEKTSCGCDVKINLSLIGKKFKWLKVLEFDHIENKMTYWLVRCKCSKEKIMSHRQLYNNKSCGCALQHGPQKNLIGKKFGYLEVVDLFNPRNHAQWLCVCYCGNLTITKTSYLTSGATKSCGCLKYKLKPEMQINKLTLIQKVSRDKLHDYSRWECQCDCGNVKVIAASSLLSGVKSCGKCLFDVSGQKFNYLTFIKLDYTKDRKSYWMCECVCGKKISLRKDQVLSGHTKSCGCKMMILRAKSFEETRNNKYNGLYPMQTIEIASKSARAQIKTKLKRHWKTNKLLVCQSSWEVEVVKYFNTNRINFRWQSKVFKMPNGKTYRPDLYLFSTKKWIEVKGYFRKDAEEKWNWFHNEHPNSELWDKTVLKTMKII